MTNKELVIGFFIEGYVHHNYDFLMENMATDYFDNSPCAARSNQECVDVLKNTEKTFTDMEVEILDLIEEDNKVAIRIRFTATHSAEVYGIQPTGKRISFEALEIFRMENGLIVESWGYWPDMNIKELLTQNMSIDAFEKREQMLQLRAKVLQSEQERIDGAATLSVSQARKQLKETINCE